MSDVDSLRVIIVDDEPLARAVVREYLGAHSGVTIVAECGNGFDAVKAVTELAPDLMFLDVQMPKLDGFEVLELLGRTVPVIFTTAYDTYALRAFDVHAVDYLLKPFSEERLAEALSRARARLAGPEGEGREMPRSTCTRSRPRDGRVRGPSNACSFATGRRCTSSPSIGSTMSRPRTTTSAFWRMASRF